MNWLPLPVKWLPAALYQIYTLCKSVNPTFSFLFMDSQNSKGCFSRARAYWYRNYLFHCLPFW
nr:MAG TPA: hypothetical protein [Inoviridae sp.]